MNGYPVAYRARAAERRRPQAFKRVPPSSRRPLPRVLPLAQKASARAVPELPRAALRLLPRLARRLNPALNVIETALDLADLYRLLRMRSNRRNLQTFVAEGYLLVRRCMSGDITAVGWAHLTCGSPGHPFIINAPNNPQPYTTRVGDVFTWHDLGFFPQVGRHRWHAAEQWRRIDPDPFPNGPPPHYEPVPQPSPPVRSPGRRGLPADWPLPVHYPQLDPLQLPINQPVPQPRPLPYHVIPLRPIGVPERSPWEQPDRGHEVRPGIPPIRNPGGIPAPEPDVGPRFSATVGRQQVWNVNRAPRPHLRKRPARYTKEVKLGVAIRGVARTIVNMATEVGDFVDAMYQALPEEIRLRERAHGVIEKADAVYRHLELVNVGKFMQAFAANQIEDFVFGFAGQGMAKANQRLGPLFRVGVQSGPL